MSEKFENEWEILRDKKMDMIRRIRVPGGWIYQVQQSIRYDSVAGTVGRQYDQGEPTWWQPIFVPQEITSE